MRRRALRIAGAALLAALAMPAAAAAGPTGSVTLTLIENEAHHVETFPEQQVEGFPDQPAWTSGRTVAYWGKFTSQNVPPGSYRATCMWLANKYWPNSEQHKQDKRLSCTIVIAFKAPAAPPHEPSGVVLQGLVRRPVGNGELFALGYRRQLAITGGSGDYSGVRGYANIRLPWKIAFPNGLSAA
jgi:hypothetical protein